MEDKYIIIFTRLEYGQLTQTICKNKVREECEKLRKCAELNKENAYIQIEVVNPGTGEIREYWNNKKNTINF